MTVPLMSQVQADGDSRQTLSLRSKLASFPRHTIAAADAGANPAKS